MQRHNVTSLHETTSANQQSYTSTGYSQYTHAGRGCHHSCDAVRSRRSSLPVRVPTENLRKRRSMEGERQADTNKRSTWCRHAQHE